MVDVDLILTGSEGNQLWLSNERVKTCLKQEDRKEERGPLLLNAKIPWSALFCKHSDHITFETLNFLLLCEQPKTSVNNKTGCERE